MNARDVMRYGNGTWQQTLGQVPMAAWERGGVCGVWSVRQLVAHLASYEALLVDVLGSFVEARPTPVLDSLFAHGMAGFNDVEVAKRDGLSPAEALAEYDAAHIQVMDLLAQLPDELFSQPGTLPWYGAEYALDDFIAYQYYGHKREHSAQVATFAYQLAQENVVLDFNEALNARNVDEMMERMTESCLFDNTSPAPDGTYYEGQAAVSAFWERFFQNAPSATITVEELFTVGGHCAMRWRYDWVDTAGQPGHVRGADLYTFDGLRIAEKRSYVKG